MINKKFSNLKDEKYRGFKIEFRHGYGYGEKELHAAIPEVPLSYFVFGGDNIIGSKKYLMTKAKKKIDEYYVKYPNGVR